MRVCAEGRLLTRPSSSPKLTPPDTSTRNASALTNMPRRSSVSFRVLLATSVPTTRSSCPSTSTAARRARPAASCRASRRARVRTPSALRAARPRPGILTCPPLKVCTAGRGRSRQATARRRASGQTFLPSTRRRFEPAAGQLLLHLPPREVAVLYRRLRQRRAAAAHAGLVVRADFSRQHADRPPSETMWCSVNVQDVLALARPAQARADEISAFEVEGLGRGFADEARTLPLPGARRQGRAGLRREITARAHARESTVEASPALVREVRAQNLVPPNGLLEAGFEPPRRSVRPSA